MGFLSWLKSLQPAPAPVPEVSFSIEWPPEAFVKPVEFNNARILITDVEGLTPENIHQAFASSEVPPGQALIISPGLSPDTFALCQTGPVYAVKATPLPCQRLDDLLLDVALATEGVVLSGALGYGLSPQEVSADSKDASLTLPEVKWANVRPSDIGSARRVVIEKDKVTFRVWRSRGIDGLLSGLASQFKLAPTRNEQEGIARRFARFGSIDDAARLSPDAVPSLAAPEGALLLDAGYASLFFVTDYARAEASVENALVLVSQVPLSSARDVIPAMRLAVVRTRPLVVVGPVIERGALAALAVNKLRGALPSLAISLSGADESCADEIRELCEASGADAITARADLANPLSHLGQSSRVTSTRTVSVFHPVR